ncbi:MAG TPA: 50S ribosomal protein L4 [Candidatus Paceibacterota bacterium]|nr:50S ribosomal protein L4 [Candidatus Paceibacterota bacterium]
MEVKTYNQEGKETGKIALSDEVFGLPWNGDLVHQVLTSMQSNARINLAHTKDRSEVSGGGKKPWRQKGTGRARHGSTRSPIWVGGGITHGPRKEENFKKKINKKMKTKALFTVLSAKLRDNEILFAEGVEFAEPKTTEAKNMLLAWGKALGHDNVLSKKRNSVKVVTFGGDEKFFKSFRNFGNVDISELRNMNIQTVLSHKYLVITDPKESVDFLERKLEAKKNAPVSATK